MRDIIIENQQSRSSEMQKALWKSWESWESRESREYAGKDGVSEMP